MQASNRYKVVIPRSILLAALFLSCSRLFVGVAMAQAPERPPTFDNGFSPSGITPAGEPVAGLALSLLPGRPAYRLGSPIWVIAELRNLYGQELSIGSLFMNNYELRIVDRSTGRSVELYPNWQGHASAFTGLGGVSIPAQMSHYAALRLDSLVPITRPGTYSVQISILNRVRAPMEGPVVSLPMSSSITSNFLTIQVLPESSISVLRPWSVGDPLGGSDTTPAGPAANGFALSLPPQRSKIEIGAPIPVTVELRNVSGAMHTVVFGSPQDSYEYTITDSATGSVVSGTARISNHVESDTSEWPIYGGSSLYRNLDLRPSYKFAPGSLTLRVIGRPAIDGQRVTLESNPVEITLTAPATPVPRVALADSRKVMSVRLETDRSVFVQGEPVRVRFVVTNLIGAPLDYLTACSPFALRVVGERGENLGASPCETGVDAMPRRRIRLGTTRMGWWGGQGDHPWANLELWGYRLSNAGEYAIDARGAFRGTIATGRATFTFSGANMIASPPVLIRILEKTAAQAQPGEKLDDPSLSAAFRGLSEGYSQLSLPLRDSIVQVAMGVRPSQLLAKLGAKWESNEQGLRARINRLPSSGNSKSPYQAVNANLEQAVYELGAAEDRALHHCDAVAATEDLKVADYFFRAVQAELKYGVSKPGDAADPPPAATGTRDCPSTGSG